jgi:prepilin peptidase CpaA
MILKPSALPKDMNIILWIPALVVVVVAAATDICWRRIPNWLSLPALVAGVIASAAVDGVSGLERSLGGVVLAVLILGILCWLRSMGMGDLKLFAAVGAWIGPEALLFALVITGMAGGIFAVIYALWKGRLSATLDGAALLLTPAGLQGPRNGKTYKVTDREALTIPYAPAIAIGVVFSFFAN